MRRLSLLVFVVAPVAFIVYVFVATPDPPAAPATPLAVREAQAARDPGTTQALLAIQQVVDRQQVIKDAFDERIAWADRRWKFAKLKLGNARDAVTGTVSLILPG